MRRRLLLPLSFLLAACSNSFYTPDFHFSADHRTVACFAPNPLAYNKPTAVTLLDLPSGKATTVPLGNFRKGLSVEFLGNRLFARTTAGAGDTGQVAELLLDKHGRFSPAPALAATRLPAMSGPVVFNTWYQPFLGTYRDQPALYVPATHTHVFAWPSLAPLATLDDPLRGVGDGYMLRYHWPAGIARELTNWGGWMSKPTDPYGLNRTPIPAEFFDLLSPAGDVIMTVEPHPDLPRELFDDREAQLSPDHRTLLLAPLWHGYVRANAITPSVYPSGFAVLDVPSGRILYTAPVRPRPRGRGTSPEPVPGRIASVATLTNDAVYTIEEFPSHSPAPRYGLARYDASSFQRIVELPISGPGFHDPIPTAAAPSAAPPFLLVYTDTPRRALLQVPLRSNVTPADLRLYPLP